jgi:predicted RNase H-like HicB family nuclease/predicted RNA binding protein YcfA (HicA-like mRNA interferase family)
MNVRDVIRDLEAHGWRAQRQRGNHRTYPHPDHPDRRVVVVIAGNEGTDVPTRSTVTVGARSRRLRMASAQGGAVLALRDRPTAKPGPTLQGAQRRYSVVYEHGDTSWGAYVPAFPGCFAVGADRAEVETLIVEAIVVYLDDLRDTGQPAPRLAAPPE